MNGQAMIPERVREALSQSAGENKITYLSAGPGWGKTTAAGIVLASRHPFYTSVRPEVMPRFPAREALVVLDDYHNLSPRLVDYMTGVLRRSPTRQRLVILSRAPLPAHLTGREGLCRLDGGDLALGETELSELARSIGLALPPQELARSCRGHPVLARLVLEESARGTGDGVLARACRRLGLYYDRTLFCRLEPEAQRLLLYTAFFDRFTPELAAALTGCAWSVERLEALESAGAPIVRVRDGWTLREPELMAGWLREKAETTLGREEVRRVYTLGGGWYAGSGQTERAVRCFEAAEDRTETAALLSRCARSHAGGWHIARLSGAFRRLSRQETAGDPALLYSLGLLDLLELDGQSVKVRREELARLAGAGSTEARTYLNLLSLLQPEGPSPAPEDLGDGTLSPDVLAMGLPSVLRGCRDLSETMSEVNSQARQGQGPLWELLQDEWALERGGNPAELCLRLSALQQRLDRQGSEQARFVCAALTARALCAGGQAEAAWVLLSRFRAQAEGDGPAAGSLDALLCRVDLLRGGGETERWLARQDGAEPAPFLLDLFRQMTMARCRMRRGEYSVALLLLGRMLERLEVGVRPLDRQEALVLTAVCCWRSGSEEWRGYLREALEVWTRFGCSAAMSGEGAAVLPLLVRLQGEERGRWTPVMERVIAQAQRYPGYLPWEDAPLERLTPREKTVYRLMRMKKSVAETAEILGIRPSTVKSHKRSIEAKLKAAEQERSVRR